MIVMANALAIAFGRLLVRELLLMRSTWLASISRNFDLPIPGAAKMEITVAGLLSLFERSACPSSAACSTA
jgi:hypothetical protein